MLIRQYRYPLDAYIYELPAGLVDGDETPAQAAVRAMKEATGLTPVSYTHLVRDIQPVLLSGVSKGACPLAHDFA